MHENLVLQQGRAVRGEAGQRAEAGTTVAAEPMPSYVPIQLTHRQRLAVGAALVVAGIVFLYFVRHILPPFIWAVVAAYVLNPVVNWFQHKTRSPRVLVVAVIYIVILAGIGWGISTLLPAIRSESTELQQSYPSILGSLEENFLSQQPLAFLGIHLDPKMVSDGITQWLRSLPGGAFRALTRTFEVLGNILIFLVATFYLLVDSQRIGRGFCSLIPPPYRAEIMGLGSQINSVLGKYIRGQIFLVALMSTVTWIALSPILHLRFALVISLATGVLELFPIVGPISAGAIAVSVALFQDNPYGWPPMVYGLVIVGVYTVLRYAEDYLVIPNVIGRVVKLHPLVILFALFSGATLGGILGMFIAVPVTAVIKILLTYLYGKLIMEPVCCDE